MKIPMPPPLPPSEYPRPLIAKLAALDGLTFLIGVAILISPFLLGYYPDAYLSSVPGSQETTIHVALGAGIATFAFFRVTVAYGSAWAEVVLFVLGLLTFVMPRIMDMTWNAQYNNGHMAAGGAIMVLSVLSALVTITGLKDFKPGTQS